jgi:hypothetical protein
MKEEDNNKIKAYRYTDIEDQTMVTHGPKRRLITATELAELPEPPLSEQIKIFQRREQQQREQEQELQSRISPAKLSNIRKELLKQYRSSTDNYPDIKKVALSEETSWWWSQEELFSRGHTFWQKFEELANSDSGIVDHAKLEQALTTSNKKFFPSAGDVLLMIEIMLRTGKVIEVGFHKYIKKDQGV